MNLASDGFDGESLCIPSIPCFENESKLDAKVEKMIQTIQDEELCVHKAYSNAVREWIHLCKSQQRSSSDVFQAIEMKRSSDRLLSDVKEDMLDYMKVTHGNITAMWEFARRFYQKLQSSLSVLQLEIYQENKSPIQIEKELDDLGTVTKEWTKKSICYFQTYESIFHNIPMEKAIERIRSKYGSMKKLRQQIGSALTPGNLLSYATGGFGPLAITVAILSSTIGCFTPVGIGLLMGATILGLLICGGICVCRRRRKKRKMELERLQAILDRFTNQFNSLGSKVDQEGFQVLLEILQNIHKTTKEFETVFLPTEKERENENAECVICREDFKEEKKECKAVAPNTCAKFTSHYFHESCLKQWEATKGAIEKRCPTCRTKYTKSVYIKFS